MSEKFHTIVIGAGSGGMTVAVELSGLGNQVAFIEGNHIGGDCTNVGCVPSKTLIHLAREFDTNVAFAPPGRSDVFTWNAVCIYCAARGSHCDPSGMYEIVYFRVSPY